MALPPSSPAPHAKRMPFWMKSAYIWVNVERPRTLGQRVKAAGQHEQTPHPLRSWDEVSRLQDALLQTTARFITAT